MAKKRLVGGPRILNKYLREQELGGVAPRLFEMSSSDQAVPLGSRHLPQTACDLDRKTHSCSQESQPFIRLTLCFGRSARILNLLPSPSPVAAIQYGFPVCVFLLLARALRQLIFMWSCSLFAHRVYVLSYVELWPIDTWSNGNTSLYSRLSDQDQA